GASDPLSRGSLKYCLSLSGRVRSYREKQITWVRSNLFRSPSDIPHGCAEAVRVFLYKQIWNEYLHLACSPLALKRLQCGTKAIRGRGAHTIPATNRSRFED